MFHTGMNKIKVFNNREGFPGVKKNFMNYKLLTTEKNEKGV
jgi:hypothetical protein